MLSGSLAAFSGLRSGAGSDAGWCVEFLDRERWRRYYNEARPHSSVDDLTPTAYAERPVAWRGRYVEEQGEIPFALELSTVGEEVTAISETNPWVSYSIYGIVDHRFTLGYGEVQEDSNGLPADFNGVYAMEEFVRAEVATEITGNPKNQGAPH